jgi:hypothetical protein
VQAVAPAAGADEPGEQAVQEVLAVVLPNEPLSHCKHAERPVVAK